MNKWCLLFFLHVFSQPILATPLPPEEVFHVEARQTDPNSFVINWQIKRGYFLYHDRIHLNESPNGNVHLGTIYFPKAELKTDSRGHKYPIYRNQLSLPVATISHQPGEALIQLRYQGCADEGFCYPPETKQLKLTINQGLALTHANIEGSTLPPPNHQHSENSPLEKQIEKQNWLMIIFSFFGVGILLSFTPCVLPMVPVLSGIIVGHGHNLSTRKAFFLSLSYVLSMSITYALVGAGIALLGSNLQIIMQSPWTISCFSLIFILLALSMFGYYQLRLPVSWQAKLALTSRHQATGHYLGAAIMGCLSTLILSPCVTAPLIAILSYVARTGNVALGSLALFFLSLGMGAPLLIIATSAARCLPKVGKWMNSVQTFFGILMLGVAIYLLGRILPGPLTMGLWASLLIFSGIYSGALTKALSNQDKFYQGLGIMLLVYGLLILIGASMGANNPLQPLARFQASPLSTQAAPVAVVKTIDEARFALAQAKGKPVILDFYADWCSSCQEMETMIKSNPRIQAALKNVVLIKADITASGPQEQALLHHFQVVAPPTFLFFNNQGIELKEQRMVGKLSESSFLKQLDSLPLC